MPRLIASDRQAVIEWLSSANHGVTVQGPYGMDMAGKALVLLRQDAEWEKRVAGLVEYAKHCADEVLTRGYALTVAQAKQLRAYAEEVDP
jgi:hypothetical protein